MGSNYLLNAGPAPDGTIPDVQRALLARIGRWYHAVKESFGDAVPASDLTVNQDVLLTRRADTLYVHLYRDPEAACSLRSDPCRAATDRPGARVGSDGRTR